MKITRRAAVAALGAAPVAGSIAGTKAAASEELLRVTVARLSWTLTQPSSSNTQIGFGMQCSALKGHVSEYLRQYVLCFEDLPSQAHLYAAGTAIMNQPFWGPFNTMQRFEVSEENFTRLWRIANYRQSSVPALSDGELFPPAAAPTPDNLVRVHQRFRPVREIKIAADRQFEDLVWLYGDTWLALKHAISHLWEDATFIRAGSSLELNEDGTAPDPELAWQMVRRKSAQARKFWAQAQRKRARTRL
jgi:hypothetical protein